MINENHTGEIIKQKVVKEDEIFKFTSLKNLYRNVKSISSNSEFINKKKHELPYILTSEVESGLLNNQKGNHNLLILDIDEKGNVNRKYKVEIKQKKNRLSTTYFKLLFFHLIYL